MRAKSLNPLLWLDRLIALTAGLGFSDSFIRFAIVGTLGFVWDTSTVYALRPFINLYLAGICGFLVAATLNWLCHRFWTFRAAPRAAAHVQWAKFISTNVVGFIFNRGTFFLLISFSQLVAAHPVIGTASGAIIGLGFNYLLSKRFVFQ